MNQKIQMLKGEFWYGLASIHGPEMPLSEKSDYTWTPTTLSTANQEAPFLVSSKGRYIWSEFPFDVEVKNGTIAITNAADDLMLKDGYGTLKNAYIAAAKAHFPGSGDTPPKNFFTKPQYNTWVELIYNQTQEGVLRYAHGIIDNGLPPGILMIDDGWNRYYGNLTFNPTKFPDPKGMCKELQQMGFEVMLWVCPFISPDSEEFRDLRDRGLLIKNSDGTVAVREWWNGFSGILDLTNPEAAQWFDEQLHFLMDEYGVVGFKFDAGDICYYQDDDDIYEKMSAHDACAVWAKLGFKYPYNELRATYKCGGMPLIQRLCDKAHKWNSVEILVPDVLTAGILGSAFLCPDMIGGGSFVDFLPNAPTLDCELFVRYAQTAALMPTMQYSAAPWRVLDKDSAAYCIAAGKLHDRFADYIYELAQQAAVTCEPIARYMEYVFPEQGLGDVNDQFMLGDKILVAPVTKKGATVRTVRLPKGTWKYWDGTLYTGSCTVDVPAPIDVLPWFELVSEEK